MEDKQLSVVHMFNKILTTGQVQILIAYQSWSRMETIWNFLRCELTTVSQGPLLDHDKIYTLIESVS